MYLAAPVVELNLWVELPWCKVSLRRSSHNDDIFYVGCR